MSIEAYPEYHRFVLRLWKQRTTIEIKEDRYYITENFIEEFNDSLVNAERELVYEEDVTSLLREKSFDSVEELAKETKIIYKEKGRGYCYSCDNNESMFRLTRLKVELDGYTEVLGEEKCHPFGSCYPSIDIDTPLYFVNIDGKITFETDYSAIEDRLDLLTKGQVNPLALFETMYIMEYTEDSGALKHIKSAIFSPVAYVNDEKFHLLDNMYSNKFTDLSWTAAQISKAAYHEYGNLEIEVRLILNGDWYSREESFETAKIYRIKDVKTVCENCVVTPEAMLDFMYQTLREGNGKKKKILKILEKFYQNRYKAIDCTQKVPKPLLNRVQLKNQPWHSKQK